MQKIYKKLSANFLLSSFIYNRDLCVHTNKKNQKNAKTTQRSSCMLLCVTYLVTQLIYIFI